MFEGKTFTASTEADHQLAPIPFTLTGTYRQGARRGDDAEATWTETFGATAVMPLAAGYALRDAFIEDDGTGKRGVNPAAVITFLRASLPSEDARRFMELVNDPDRMVKLEVLADVMKYLTEAMTGNPSSER